jgi:hypothetical protein
MLDTPLSDKMATGPVIASNEADNASTSSMESAYLPETSNESNNRRHSMVFRSNRQSSSSEDELADFSVDLNDIHKRRYSVDLHLSRRSPKKRSSFALSSSDNIDSELFATPMVKMVRFYLSF